MRNRLMMGIGLLLLIGVGLYSVFDSPEKVEKIDLPQVKMASSMNDVKQYFYRNVPALERAEELSLIGEINQTYELPGVQAEVTIDEAWYNGRTIYLFYHRDVASIGKASINNKEEMPVPQLYTPNVHNQSFIAKVNDESIPLLAMASDIEGKHGIQLGNKFYSFVPLSVDSNVPLEGNALTIKGSPMINVDGQVQEIDLSVSFKAHEDVVKSMRINETFSYKDYNISFNSINFGTFGTDLRVTIKHPKDELPKNMHVSATTNQGERLQFSGWFVENKQTQEIDNDYIIKGHQVVQSLPKEMKFTLQTVSFESDQSITFKMDTTRLPNDLEEKDTYEEQPEETIEVFDQAEVSLESIRYNSSNLTIRLRKELTNGLKAPFRTVSFRVDPSQFQPIASTASDSDTTILYSGRESHSLGEIEKLSLSIPSSEVRNEDYVQISLNNLPFSIVFKEARNVEL
ncbi:hypothetical protein [Pontibacillus salipaludis]|uniref:DUF4179 domain-containing protein n=1 Tax=Pontibacillus salipaludis TaxID=1697394 RepID=A0ABQ1Q7D3_9BACI|nr:hypothetical protein [Pontibacillus salipaludis]GGD15292.1 hypothetical protein GCM10011389_23740 [Pontibacillus salipaludis]